MCYAPTKQAKYNTECVVGIESLTCTHFSIVRIQVKVMHNVQVPLWGRVLQAAGPTVSRKIHNGRGCSLNSWLIFIFLALWTSSHIYVLPGMVGIVLEAGV